MHSLVIAGSLVIEFVNQLMIYGNTLHESCSLNKILQFNKEHGVNSSSRYRVTVQLEIAEFCHQLGHCCFVLIAMSGSACLYLCAHRAEAQTKSFSDALFSPTLGLSLSLSPYSCFITYPLILKMLNLSLKGY